VQNSWLGVAFGVLCLASALVLIAVSVLMQRRLKGQPVERPTYV
jgi:hypothetical protein